MSWTAKELEAVIERVVKDEFTMHLSVYVHDNKPQISVTLSKGSSYGKMHMEFRAAGATITEAFEKCLENFPRNPIGAIWDSRRIAPPAEDATFTEMEQ